MIRTMTVAALAATLSFVASARAELIYAVAQGLGPTSLVTFDSSDPANILDAGTIKGLGPNESVLGIDFRPATGELFALGSSNRLYTVDIANPNALSYGTLTPVGANLGIGLNGSNFGFDFNPQIDRIRIVSDTDRNYVANPNTGTAALFTNLFYAAGDPNVGMNPNVVDSAYDRNIAGTPATQLFGIDAGKDILVKQANSAGTLTTVGGLGIPVGAVGGFDISGASGTAYAVLTPEGLSISNLYTINLATGAASLVGQVDGGLFITAMSVAVPEPASLGLLACLAGCFALRRSR